MFCMGINCENADIPGLSEDDVHEEADEEINIENSLNEFSL